MEGSRERLEFPREVCRRTIFLDRQGTLWVSTEDTLVFLPPGARRFQPTGIRVGQVTQIAQAASGKLWMAETTRSVRPIPLSDKRQPPDETEVQVGSAGILFDNDGALWITSLGDGLRRSPAPELLKGQDQGIQHRGRVVHRQGWIKRRCCPRHSSRPRRKYLGRNQQRSGSLPQNEPGAGRSPLQARLSGFGCRRRRRRLG